MGEPSERAASALNKTLEQTCFDRTQSRVAYETYTQQNGRFRNALRKSADNTQTMKQFFRNYRMSQGFIAKTLKNKSNMPDAIETFIRTSETFQSSCPIKDIVFNYIDDSVNSLRPCFTPAEVKSMDVLRNVTESIQDFICNNGFQHLADHETDMEACLTQLDRKLPDLANNEEIAASKEINATEWCR